MLKNPDSRWRTSDLILRLVILSMALPDTGAGSAIPILELMMQDMPDVNPALIQMVFTIPSVCLIIFVPMYTKLIHIFSRKTLLISALTLFLIGSIGPIYSNNIYVILFFRFLLGVSSGIYSPFELDLTITFFRGDDQRRMLSLTYFFVCIGGILYQTLGGVFGTINWHNAFWANMIAVPFFLFAIIFLPGYAQRPKLVSPKTVHTEETATPANKIPPTFREVIMLIFSVWNEMCLFVLMTCGSTYVIAGGYGDAKIAGIVVSMFTVGGLFLAPCFGAFFKVFRWHTLAVGNLILAMGLGCFAFGDSVVLCFVGALLCGGAQAVFLPCMQNMLSEIAPAHRRSAATTLTYTARGIGGFISPYVFAVFYIILGTAIGRPSFIYGTASTLLLFVVLMLIINKIKPTEAESALND